MKQVMCTVSYKRQVAETAENDLLLLSIQEVTILRSVLHPLPLLKDVISR
jgi:hypothetical protein